MVHQRPVTVAFIVAGIAGGVLVQSIVRMLLPLLGSEDVLVAGLVQASLILGVVGGFATFFLLLRNEKARTFTDSVVSELLEVTWPTRDETVNNTGIVVGAAVFFASLLAVYDLVWMRLSELVLYTTG